MYLSFIISLALGGGIGLQPPLDIHIPNKEEISKDWERENGRRKKSDYQDNV